MSKPGARTIALVAALALAVLAFAAFAECNTGGTTKVPSGVLRVGSLAPATLDPAKARTVDELRLADDLFDSLTAWDPASGDAVPSLAASWHASDDQQHWDFSLRKGARFSNGREITADDVKYSLDRIVALGKTSSVADLLEPVSSITVSAPDVVHLDLASPLAVFPSILANPGLGIVAKEAVDAPAPVFADAPVGSGPFRLASRTTSLLRLVPSAGHKLRIRRLDVHLFASKDASYRAFAAGRLDFSDVPGRSITSAGATYGRAHFGPYAAELFYAFNLRSATFSDARVREAIVRAVDSATIVRTVYGSSAAPMQGFLVPGLPGADTGACGDTCSFDRTKAKALLADYAAGGASLPALRIDFEDDPTQSAVAASIKRDLEAVGFTVSLAPKPLPDYESFVVSGQQELFLLGWIAPYPSPDAVLSPLFRSDSRNNLTGLSSATVDDLLRRARAAGDPSARTDAYRQAEREVFSSVPVIPIAQFSVHVVASKRVRGLRLTSVGTFDAGQVWLARP